MGLSKNPKTAFAVASEISIGTMKKVRRWPRHRRDRDVILGVMLRRAEAVRDGAIRPKVCGSDWSARDFRAPDTGIAPPSKRAVEFTNRKSAEGQNEVL
jgi:hypothetical protein